MGGWAVTALGHRFAIGGICAGLLVAASLVCALQARAHTRSVSYSSWVLDPQGATVTLRVTQLELTRLPWGPAWGAELAPGLATYLTDRLQLLSGGTPCSVADGPRVLTSARDRAAIEWRVECASGGPREIKSRLLLEVAPSHLHFARVSAADEAVLERVLTSTGPSWRLAPEGGEGAGASTTGSSLGSYLMLGIQHIGTGPDHLAFVLALILIAARFGEVATVITGFTVAHSITLAVAVLGLAKPESQEVGALVGLSIVLVAAENIFLLSGRPRSIPRLLALGLGAMALLSLLGVGGMGALTLAGMTLFTLCYFGLLGLASRPARLRFAIAFAFGLVHGFGFAGVLVDVSLPTGRLVPALLGFNLGVEVGQLVLVAALWPVLRDLARVRHGKPHRILVEIGSAALCSVGMFWLLTRAFG
jgi:hypothetical protein